MKTDLILRRPELLNLIGVSRSTLYKWMADGHFPYPIRLGKRAVGWKSKAVLSWLENRPTAGGCLA